jgi:Uma2 family endonuclease
MLDTLEPPRYTYGDYVLWHGDERWELIDGEAFLMSPAPGLRHQRVVGELYFEIATYLKGRDCEVYVAPIDVRLPKAGEADQFVDTVLQPDLVVVCDKNKLDEAGVRGAPDLVVEVLSPSTASRDEVIKRKLYELHGVREYWIVDPAKNQLRIFKAGSGGFESPVVCRDHQVPSRVLPGLELELASLFRW